MRESRTTVKYRDQNYTICVDDDTRMAIDDVIKYQRSHPERTTVTIEPRLKSFRPYVAHKKSRFGRIRDWFLDSHNSEVVLAIGLFIVLPLVIFGAVSVVYQKKNDFENRAVTDRTENSSSSDKPSYEVIEFK